MIDSALVLPSVALLAEILKSQPWNMASLTNLGGMRGIGVRYLEQVFDSSASPPHFRRHQDAILKMLVCLLPADSISIRGQRVDLDKLAPAAGYEFHKSNPNVWFHERDPGRNGSLQMAPHLVCKSSMRNKSIVEKKVQET